MKKAVFGAEAHAWLPGLANLAREAGEVIMRHYRDAEAAKLFDKADGSPLTAADMAAHETIIAGLRCIAPDIYIISEENKHNPQMAEGAQFWMVDPLDGTKEFLNRNGEFTVNIALVQNGLPVLSVVHAPALGMTYVGQHGVGAWRIKDEGMPQPISVSTQGDELRVVASRSHSDEKTTLLLQKLQTHRVVSAGSSLKFCMIAEGSADFYPRLGTTMEWDTAAAQCVLEAAGGRVMQSDDNPLLYNKPGWRNPHFFAVGVWQPVYGELTNALRSA